jgi:hypothetical protein
MTRELPGVLECGLWGALDSHIQRFEGATGPRVALVTDIGNDLLYQVPLNQVVSWLEECLDRLHALGFDIVVTSLPMTSVLSMGMTRFLVARHLLFPSCRLTWSDVRTCSTDLDCAVRSMADTRGLEVIIPSRKWYSADPIHIRQSRQRRAFELMCSRWKTMGPIKFGRFPWDRAHFWWNMNPHRRWIRRSERIQPQPVWRGPKGNVLCMY